MAHVYKLFSAYKLENIFYAFALHLGQKKTFGLISSLPELSAAEVQLKIHSPSFPAHLPKSFSWVLPSFQRQKEKGNHRFIFCGLFPTFLEFLYQPPSSAALITWVLRAEELKVRIGGPQTETFLLAPAARWCWWCRICDKRNKIRFFCFSDLASASAIFEIKASVASPGFNLGAGTGGYQGDASFILLCEELERVLIRFSIIWKKPVHLTSKQFNAYPLNSVMKNEYFWGTL